MTRTPLVLLVVTALCLAGACSSSRETGTTTQEPTGTLESSSQAQTALPSATAGTSHGTLQYGALTRTYRLFVPRGLVAGQRVPLVVALHGGLGSGDQFADNSRFEQLAEAEKFVVVFPDGVGRTWNGGGCCGQAATRNIDDVGFLAALIQSLERDFPVDATKVFMTGHSNGGIMSFRFGCERPDLVKAVAPVAGSLETPGCKPSRGTSLLAIHGDSDQNHPLEGGKGSRSIAGVPFTSMAESLSLWTAGMKCAPPKRSVSGDVATTDWSGCRDGAVARFVVIAGADHPWPGGAARNESLEGRTSTALDATAEVWKFFVSLN